MRENNVKAAVLSNKPDNMTCYIAEKLFTGLLMSSTDKGKAYRKNRIPAPHFYCAKN